MFYTAWLNSDNKAIGAAVGKPDSSNGILNASTANITTTADTDLFSAPGANKYNWVNFLIVTNSDPTNGTWVNLKDENNTILATGWAAPNSGFILPLNNTPVRSELPNKKIVVACESATAGVRATAVGYVSY